MNIVRIAIGSALTLLAAAAASAASAPNPAGNRFFEMQVRPLLAQHCYACHSAASQPAQGGLRLDNPSGWLHGGSSGAAVVPGDAAHSLLIQAVGYKGALRMPPGGKLSDAEIGALSAWVKLGAPAPAGDSHSGPRVINMERERRHWAYQPLQHVLPPQPPAAPAERTIWGWVRTPVDRFILQKLRQNGLRPNPPADRRTLIRRVYLDLVGLPPTPKEIEAFVQDHSPDAYSRVVDRLLASPHYGERWARHWLDLARYAESHGFEQDYDRPYAYRYRDFVIRAFNEDMPYNQFVRWQLAGDELAPGNPQALMATGFLAAGVHSTQITKNQVEKERYDELDDMLATTGTAMLGLTVGCARCHDHKYDPIPTKDYYRLLSTFTTTVRSDMDIEMDPSGDQIARKVWEGEHAILTALLSRYERDVLPQRMQNWLQKHPSPGAVSTWTLPELLKAESTGGATLTPQEDGSIRASGTNPDFDTYKLIFRTRLTGITAIRLEALSDPSLPHGGPGRADNGNFALTDVQLSESSLPPTPGASQLAAPVAVPVKLISARATFEQTGLPVKAAIDADPKSAWAVDPQFGKDHAAAFGVEKPCGFPGGTLLTLTLRFENNTGHNMGRVRVSLTHASPDSASLTEIAAPERVTTILDSMAANGNAGGIGRLSPEDNAALLEWYRSRDPGWQSLNRKVQSHLAAAPHPRTEMALICSEGVQAVRLHTQGEDFFPVTYQLRRGDPGQKMGIVHQGFLQVLTHGPQGEKRWQESPPAGWRTSYRRRSLANWIVDTEDGAGALLARVIVNRVWQHHFGRGIVSTPSDFGTQGDPPSHPELLDWLAGKFIKPTTPADPYACGWSLKRLHRLILNSAVYEQSSAVSAVKARLDPANRLCSRHSRQRLEAEVIRDCMLSVSGLLDPTLFGPGTLDDSVPRRSIYLTIKRSQLIPFMTLFDAPDALEGIAVRTNTTVAPQALLLMNGRSVRDWARSLAHRVAPAPGIAPETVVRTAFLITFSRPPDAAELHDSLRFLADQAASYRNTHAPDPDAAALTDFCQALMASNEFVYAE